MVPRIPAFRISARSRLILTFAPLLLATRGAHAQAQLPPTSPTSLPAPIAATPLTGPVATKPHRATVTYAAGLLDVRANDSSLNSILREIARLTGMTITGGVADQRVFGNYGPAEPSTVLATLLDGTGTNVFLKESADNAPAELQLTPRAPGGPTPPSPSASEFNNSDDDGQPPQPGAAPLGPLPFIGMPPRPGPGYNQVPPTATQQAPPPGQSPGAPGPPGTTYNRPGPVQPPSSGVLGNPNAVSPSASTLPVTNSVPVDALGTPSTAQPVAGVVDSPSGPPTGSTTQGYTAAATANANSSTTPTNDADTSGSTLPGGSTNSAGSGSAPNGVRTPEQIFEQLQQLRRSAQAQSGTSATTTPATPTPAATPQPQ